MSMLPKVEYSSVSVTKQSMRDECDINVIVARARKGQAITHVNGRIPSFQDVSEVGDYKGALDMLRSADAFFAALPSKVRLGFGNDPAAFLDAVGTPEGRSKLEDAGLIPPVPVVDPAKPVTL